MRASPPASPEIEAQLGADPAGSGFWQKFLEALRELNYVEGRNLTVRRAFANGRVDRLPRLVADPVQAKVDVIVTTSTGKWRKNEANSKNDREPDQPHGTSLGNAGGSLAEGHHAHQHGDAPRGRRHEPRSHALSDFVGIDLAAVRRASSWSRWTPTNERQAAGIGSPACCAGRKSRSKSSRPRSARRSMRSGSKPRDLC
jgi:hypothetical protein